MIMPSPASARVSAVAVWPACLLAVSQGHACAPACEEGLARCCGASHPAHGTQQLLHPTSLTMSNLCASHLPVSPYLQRPATSRSWCGLAPPRWAAPLATAHTGSQTPWAPSISAGCRSWSASTCSRATQGGTTTRMCIPWPGEARTCAPRIRTERPWALEVPLEAGTHNRGK